MSETIFSTGLYEASTLRGGVVWLLRKDVLRREAVLTGDAAQALLRDVREAQDNFDDAMARDRAINATCNFYYDEALKQRAVK